MNLEEKRRAYQAFFTKAEAGKAFMATLEATIDANHRKAEDDPALAPAYTQRAAGIREIIEHIQVVTAERGKATE
jgi:hypothetical protein